LPQAKVGEVWRKETDEIEVKGNKLAPGHFFFPYGSVEDHKINKKGKMQIQ